MLVPATMAMKSHDRYDAFIAYHGADARAAFELARRLRVKRCRIWICPPYPNDSKQWVQAVRDALGNCRSIVVTIGPGGVGGTERYEWLRFSDEKPKGTVIPVLLPKGTWHDESIPGLLKDMKRIRFRRSLDEPNALAELVSAIHSSAS